MNLSAITHEFHGNVCKLKISIPKRVHYIENCDIFVDEHNFVFNADVDIKRFKCPRSFDIKDMKNIPIAFDTERWEYTCRLPCYPDESKAEKIEKGELEKKNSHIAENIGPALMTLSRITDSCILTIDGELCAIRADFGYGFSGFTRGKPKCSEVDLFHTCRITKPHLISPISRTILRERDEVKDFCPDQYKLNFVELQIPDGHENPINYTIPFDDVSLTTDQQCVLHNIISKDFAIKLDAEQINIDCGLISILLAICYDVRSTSNEVTCESSWTRTILSSALSYFERFENLSVVVESFLRRCLIYPLYRNYDLGRLCVEDTVEALLKGKSWIVKQLVITFNCFCLGDFDRKHLNNFFIRQYIRYVAKVLDDDHLHTLSRNLKNVLLDTNKKQLRLGLGEIETELLKELIDEMHLTATDSGDDDLSGYSELSTQSEDGSDETDERDSCSETEKI